MVQAGVSLDYFDRERGVAPVGARFLLDTGSDVTVLRPWDALQVGITAAALRDPPASWPRAEDVDGVSHGTRAYPFGGRLHLEHAEGGQSLLRGTIRVGGPGFTFPHSILGMNVLQFFDARIEHATGTVVLHDARNPGRETSVAHRGEPSPEASAACRAFVEGVAPMARQDASTRVRQGYELCING